MKSSTNSHRTSTTKQLRNKSKASPAPLPAPMPRPGGKLGVIIDRLAGKNGATADELVAATGWQRHSVLGALSRLKSRGFAFQIDTHAARRAYQLDIAAKPAAQRRAKG